MENPLLTSIELTVPSGQRLVDITASWCVLVQGKFQNGYSSEEALLFATLADRPDRILKIDELPSLTMATYEKGLELGGTELGIIEMRPNKFTGGQVQAKRIRGVVERLLRPRLGPLASSIYQFRAPKLSYVLCTDIATPDKGLQIIADQSGDDEDVHAAYFVAQHKKRVDEELKYESIRPDDTEAPKPRVRPKPQPQVRSFTRGVTAQNSPENVEELSRDKLLAILHGAEGTVTRSVELYYELIQTHGFSRRDADKLLHTVDRFIAAGYIKKAVDPANNQHAIYIRTAEPLRLKKQ